MTDLEISYAESSLGLTPGQYPFPSSFIEIEGACIHYVDIGQGPVLFMLHGNPTWSFLYRKLIQALQENFRCIAMDLPGFGLSSPPPAFGFRPEDHAPIVSRFLAQLDLREATLVAHDWGGPIGLAAALAVPGRLTRFVLGNTWAWPVNGQWHFEWFSKLMGGPVGRFMAPRWNLFVNGVLPSSMRRGPLPKAVLQGYQAPFRHGGDISGTHVFPKCITASRDFLVELEAGLARIDGRQVLFVWPDADIAFRATELARWRQYWPQATINTLPRCGHFLWEEAARECAEAIASWHAR